MSHSAVDWVTLIFLGGLLGTVGQGIRVVVGMKKVNDQAIQEKKDFATLFSPSTLFFSLLVGFIAGALGMLTLTDVDPANLDTKQVLLPLLGIGYAGADFIEGFVRKNTAQFSGAGAGTAPAAQSNVSSPENADQPAMG